jgi:phage gp46-like protein
MPLSLEAAGQAEGERSFWADKNHRCVFDCGSLLHDLQGPCDGSAVGTSAGSRRDISCSKRLWAVALA